MPANVRGRLSDVHAPSLIVHSQEDDISSLRNVEIVRRGVSGTTEVLLLEDSHHMITVDQQRDLLIQRTADFFLGRCKLK